MQSAIRVRIWNQRNANRNTQTQLHRRSQLVNYMILNFNLILHASHQVLMRLCHSVVAGLVRRVFERSSPCRLGDYRIAHAPYCVRWLCCSCLVCGAVPLWAVIT